MDQYIDLEKLSDIELIAWLEKQSLYGFNLTLARRFAKLHAHYWRQRQELDNLHASLHQVLSDLED